MEDLVPVIPSPSAKDDVGVPNNENTVEKPPVEGEQTPPSTPPVPQPQNVVDEEPPTRKTKLDYILERKQQKIAKLESQLKTPPAQVEPQTPSPESGDDMSPEEDARFTKWFEKKYGQKMSAIDPLIDVTEKDHVDSQVSDFFKNDPHADLLKEFEGKIRKYAQHPSRSQVPIDEIVWGIAGKKLIGYAADAVRKAAAEARESRHPASGARKPEGISKKDYLSMPSEDFAKEQARVLQQG